MLRDEKILRLVRAEVARLHAELAEPAQRYRLDTIDAALNELALRGEEEFWRGHCERGLALLHEGAYWLSREAGAALLAELPADLPPSGRPEVFEARRLALNQCLQGVVQALGASDVAAIRDYLRRVVDWETELPARRVVLASGRTPIPAHGYTRDAVEEYLRRRFPARAGLRVTDFNSLPGGYSKLTILISTQDDAICREDIVIRANLPVKNMLTEGAEIRNEYPILEMAYGAGLPVPEPLWLESDASRLGTCFAVSRRAWGKNIGTHTSGAGGALTPALKADLLRVLLRIHAVPIDGAAMRRTYLGRRDVPRDCRACALEAVDDWMRELERFGAPVTPSVQRVYDWLVANAPEAAEFRPVFLHGDYGLHNILVANDEVVAVLDWEIARIGDPAEEFVPFFVTTQSEYDEDFVDAYVAAGGQRVSRFRVSYYMVLLLMRSLIFDAVALKHLADDEGAGMNLFHWLNAGPSYPLMSRVNAAIDRAEEVRARYGI